MALERRPRNAARLRLEPIEGRHAAPIHEVATASRDHLLPWMPWALEHEVSQEEGFAAEAEKAWAAGTAYAHALLVDGCPVGVVHLTVSHGGVGELGYWISAQAAGRGLVTEASTAVLGIAFDELNLYRVELRAGVDNVRSLRVAARLGFTREGRLRNGLDGSDGPFDAYIYGMTPADWQARGGGRLVT